MCLDILLPDDNMISMFPLPEGTQPKSNDLTCLCAYTEDQIEEWLKKTFPEDLIWFDGGILGWIIGHRDLMEKELADGDMNITVIQESLKCKHHDDRDAVQTAPLDEDGKIMHRIPAIVDGKRVENPVKEWVPLCEQCRKEREEDK